MQYLFLYSALISTSIILVRVEVASKSNPGTLGMMEEHDCDGLIHIYIYHSHHEHSQSPTYTPMDNLESSIYMHAFRNWDKTIEHRRNPYRLLKDM